MNYYLMNKDTPLMLFDIREDIGGLRCVEKERISRILPPWITDINDWVENRNYAKHKSHLKKWLREWGIDNVQGFLEITHALSLNDTLWVKPEGSSLSWRDINLYNNEFSDISERTAFESGLHGLRLSSTSPELTSEGTFDKCWKRENGTIYIYKKGSEGFANAGLEPYSEYYATNIAKRLCNDAVEYDLTMFKDNLCSKCRLFTSEERGFVPAYKLYPGKTADIKNVFDYCKDLGFEDDFAKMLVLDAIIMNPDRHMGNFGFIIDNASFEIESFAPVFDHNNSLLCRAMDDDLSSEESIQEYIDNQEHKLGGKYLTVARSLITKDILAKLDLLSNVRLIEHPRYNLSEERITVLNSIIQHNIDVITGSPYVRNIEPMKDPEKQEKKHSI